MMTLYDLLGALPDDDAEGLRTAFRRAVKGAHPDIHPGDPDAAWKFRRIVRAHEILGDEEQRAAYDHLLDLAQLEQETASGHATAARIHKLASGVIALAGFSVVTVGGYLLFMHMSAASVATADKPGPATHASASLSPALSPVTPGKSASLVGDQSAGVGGDAFEPSASIPRTDAENIAAAHVGPAPDLGTSDARPSWAWIVSVSRNGNLNGAFASPGRTSRFDGKSSPAYSISFNRLRKFDRAFADIAPTKQVEKPGHSKSAPTTASAPRLGRTAIASSMMPVP